MKEFFKTMFASALGTCLALGFLFVSSLVALGAMIAAMETGNETYVPKANSVFRIELAGGLADNVVENPFDVLLGNETTSLSLTDLLAAIRKAKQAPDIKGIYLDAKIFSGGTANVNALRRALLDFKSEGKFIVAYADYYTQSAYYLCSVADDVFMNPLGALELKGVASQAMFYTGLADKLGVKMEIFKVGTYKGAVEPYMLKQLSDENREQIASYTGSIWNHIAGEIATARELSVADVNEFANAGLSMAAQQTSVDKGFVDALKYRSEVELHVQSLAGQDSDKLKTVSLAKVKNLPKADNDSDNEIAILYAEGEITQEIGTPSYDMEQTITEDLAEELRKLQKDEDVKAVVLRVNSPGGSAFTSEQIWKEVKTLNEIKPVVVSMGNVAASGGYYISCAASKIVAESNTLTGSIGVFGMFPNMAGLFEKLDLTTDVVKTAHFADMGDTSRPMRDDERALIQGSVERSYEVFISRCAEGRKMSKQAIDAIGQGRVWTGVQAKERGLVDELGGLNTAIKSAATLAELTDYNVTEVSGKKDFFEELLEKQMEDLELSLTQKLMGDALYQQVKRIQQLQNQSGIQARLPYELGISY